MAVSQLQDIWVISKALQHPVLTRQHFGVLLVSFGSRRRHLYQKRTKNTLLYMSLYGKKLYSCHQTGLGLSLSSYINMVVQDLFKFGL